MKNFLSYTFLRISLVLVFTSCLIQSYGQVVSIDLYDFESSYPENVEDLGSIGGDLQSGDFIIDNPDKSGINTSSSVMKITRQAGDSLLGGYFWELDEAFFVGSAMELCLDYWSPVESSLLLRLEHRLAVRSWEKTLESSQQGSWERICFDLRSESEGSNEGGAISRNFSKMTLAPHVDTTDQEIEQTFYIDNIVVRSITKLIKIKFTPDEFPQDITWELQTQDNRGLVASGSLEGCLPFEECVVYEDIIEDRCYTLQIRDSEGGGINMPGGYEVIFGGEIVVNSEPFEEVAYHNFNCGPGEVCETAIPLSLPDTRIYAPDYKEYWFTYTPEERGHYRINTCKSRSVARGALDTRLWLYDSCGRALQQDGAEGALGFSNDAPEPDCPPGAGFNLLPLEAGITYYIRHKPLDDWIDITKNDSVWVTVTVLPPRIGCTDPSACNYDPFAFEDNGTCEYSVGCAPDLSLDEEELKNTIYVDTIYSNDPCFVTEGCLRGPGPREVIRFSTKIDNIGNADYIVGRPESDPLLFSNDNCHGHYHHLGYAEYLLYKGEGQPEPVGFKSGFCVLDLDCSATSRLPKYICAYMGISVGCSDIYEAALDCQWIDVTDIPDGDYSIVIRINHFKLPDARQLQEKTFDNNVGQACINIDRSSGQLIVTVKDECEEYVDCLGVEGGDAEIDCEGVCGGLAHYGDLDGSGELDSLDRSEYLNALKNKLPLSGTCSDLNNDGIISIYDAALVQDCIVEKEEQKDNPFHEHCSFPAGNDIGDQVMLRISEFNAWDQYIDLEYWSPDRDITAYQINTSGINVSLIETYYTEKPSDLMHNENNIYAMHNEVNIPRNTGFEPFIRIHFDGFTSDSLCVLNSSEFINRDYNRNTTLIEETSCFFPSSTQDEKSIDRGFTLLPNPANNNISIFANGSYVKSAVIVDLKGRSIRTTEINSVQGFQLDISELKDGLYNLILHTSDNKRLTKRFVKIQ